MREEDDKETLVSAEVERQTIRQAILARRHKLEQERLEAEERERVKEREKRAQKRKAKRQEDLRRKVTERQKAHSDAQRRVQSLVSQAARNLGAALRAASEKPMPRHTPQGRDQNRMIRDLESAMGAIRRVGSTTFHESNLDVGDIDLDAADVD